MPTPLTELGRQLAAPDARLREEASRALAELGDGSGAALLRDALEDEDASVRAWASFGLARLARSEDAGRLRCALVDADPRVRVWAAYGLARTGDLGAAGQLAAALEEGPTGVRLHAARALAALEPPALAVPHLRRLLEAGSAGGRTWAAAVLAGRGSAGALAIWRRALRHPETRVDAALSAPHLRSPLAARDLVALAAGLAPDVLRLPAGGVGSLAELLTGPLLVLGFDALLEDVEDEPELRRELYLLLGRAPGVHAAVREALLGVLRSLPPADVGRELAETLLSLPPHEAPGLLETLAPGLPDAVVAAFHGLSHERREQLRRALGERDGTRPERAPGLLSELLRPRPGPRRLREAPERDVPLSPGGLPPAKRSRGTEDALLPGTPPGDARGRPPRPAEVAVRARALGALVARALLEERFAPRGPPDVKARRAAQLLLAQLEQTGLARALEPAERDLLELSPGSWDRHDRAEARACTEALAVLLWALGGTEQSAEMPPVEGGALLARLAEAERAGTVLRPHALLVDARECCAAWLQRLEQEALLREVRAGRIPEALDVQALLDVAAAAGGDGWLAERGPGRGLGAAAQVAEALRLAGRPGVERLVAEGRAEVLVDGDLPFGGVAIAALEDAALARAREVLEARLGALTWLTGGGPWRLDGG